MTIEEIKELPRGTKLKFLDEWPEDANWPNSEGLMDHWLGHVVTLRETYRDYDFFKIEEDKDEFIHGWSWHAEIVEYIVDECEEFEIVSETALGNLFDMG